VELAWKVVEPVLAKPPTLCYYPAGTWGPDEAQWLIEPWRWHLR